MTNLATTADTDRRYGTPQAVRAELTKLRSVRSTSLILLAMVIATLLVTTLVTLHTAHRQNRNFQGFDPTNQSLAGLALGSLVIGVLGVLAVTGEYASGTIRSTLAATPRRPLLIGAKVLVVGVVALVVSEFLSFACFFTGQAILSGSAPSASIGQPGVLRAVSFTGGYLALLALFGLGLGLIIRHTSGAIATYVGCTLLLPVLLQPLSESWSRFAPESILANSVAAVVPQPGQLSATTGLVVMGLYCVAVLTLGRALLVRRDA
jgi:ABC-type transport system involved in multi-copper enzyme maturation permease subunit